jgi:hypothetical protein
LQIFILLQQGLLSVVGAPGVGKSVEVFAYAMNQAKACSKRVLYVHCIDNSKFVINFKSSNIEDTFKIGTAPFSAEPQFLLDYLLSLLVNTEVDLIVLDGAMAWLYEKLYFEMKNFPSAKVICCSSFQAFKTRSQEVHYENIRVRFYAMNSWTLDEYSKALDSKVITLSTVSAEIRRPFHFVWLIYCYLKYSMSQICI